MKKISIPMFLMVFCTFSIVYGSQEQELNIIEKALSDLSNIVVRYENEFSAKVNFSGLKDTINQIRYSNFDYKLVIEIKMGQSYALSFYAQQAYKRCVNSMYECCCWIINSVNFLFTPVNEQNVIMDYNATWIIIFLTLNEAQQLTGDSLENFKILKHNMIDLKKLLDATLSIVHTDLDGSSSGENQTQDFLKKDFEKKQFIDEKINTAIEMVARYNVDVDFHEDENSINEFSKVISSANRDNLALAMKNASLPRRSQFVSKLRDLVNQCNEYVTWYESTQ